MIKFIEPSKEEQLVLDKIEYYENVINILSNKILDLNFRYNILKLERLNTLEQEIKESHVCVTFTLENREGIEYCCWSGYFPKESYPKKFFDDVLTNEGTQYYTYNANTFTNFIDIVNKTHGVIDKLKI